MKFWEADFYDEVRQTGAARLVGSAEELPAAILDALLNRDAQRPSRQSLLERQLGVAPHASVDAAVKILLETVK